MAPSTTKTTTIPKAMGYGLAYLIGMYVTIIHVQLLYQTTMPVTTRLEPERIVVKKKKIMVNKTCPDIVPPPAQPKKKDSKDGQTQKQKKEKKKKRIEVVRKEIRKQTRSWPTMEDIISEPLDLPPPLEDDEQEPEPSANNNRRRAIVTNMIETYTGLVERTSSYRGRTAQVELREEMNRWEDLMDDLLFVVADEENEKLGLDDDPRSYLVDTQTLLSKDYLLNAAVVATTTTTNTTGDEEGTDRKLLEKSILELSKLLLLAGTTTLTSESDSSSSAISDDDGLLILLDHLSNVLSMELYGQPKKELPTTEEEEDDEEDEEEGDVDSGGGGGGSCSAPPLPPVVVEQQRKKKVKKKVKVAVPRYATSDDLNVVLSPLQNIIARRHMYAKNAPDDEAAEEEDVDVNDDATSPPPPPPLPFDEEEQNDIKGQVLDMLRGTYESMKEDALKEWLTLQQQIEEEEVAAAAATAAAAAAAKVEEEAAVAAAAAAAADAAEEEEEAAAAPSLETDDGEEEEEEYQEEGGGEGAVGEGGGINSCVDRTTLRDMIRIGYEAGTYRHIPIETAIRRRSVTGGLMLSEEDDDDDEEGGGEGGGEEEGWKNVLSPLTGISYLNNTKSNLPPPPPPPPSPSSSSSSSYENKKSILQTLDTPLLHKTLRTIDHISEDYLLGHVGPIDHLLDAIAEYDVGGPSYSEMENTGGGSLHGAALHVLSQIPPAGDTARMYQSTIISNMTQKYVPNIIRNNMMYPLGRATSKLTRKARGVLGYDDTIVTTLSARTIVIGHASVEGGVTLPLCWKKKSSDDDDNDVVSLAFDLTPPKKGVVGVVVVDGGEEAAEQEVGTKEGGGGGGGVELDRFEVHHVRMYAGVGSPWMDVPLPSKVRVSANDGTVPLGELDLSSSAANDDDDDDGGVYEMKLRWKGGGGGGEGEEEELIPPSVRQIVFDFEQDDNTGASSSSGGSGSTWLCLGGLKLWGR